MRLVSAQDGSALLSLGVTLQGAIQSLVESGFGFFVVFRGDLALLALYFQLE